MDEAERSKSSIVNRPRVCRYADAWKYTLSAASIDCQLRAPCSQCNPRSTSRSPGAVGVVSWFSWKKAMRRNEVGLSVARRRAASSVRSSKPSTTTVSNPVMPIARSASCTAPSQRAASQCRRHFHSVPGKTCTATRCPRPSMAAFTPRPHRSWLVYPTTSSRTQRGDGDGILTASSVSTGTFHWRKEAARVPPVQCHYDQLTRMNQHTQRPPRVFTTWLPAYVRQRRSVSDLGHRIYSLSARASPCQCACRQSANVWWHSAMGPQIYNPRNIIVRAQKNIVSRFIYFINYN